MRIHNRNRVFLLIFVMSSVAVMVLGVTIFVLFMSVNEQNKRIMMSYAEHQASMLQSVMKLVPEQTRLNTEPPELVVDHIRQTLARNPVITDSGEMLFAYRDGSAIHFVTPFRFDPQAPQIVADDNARAQAMRLALDGHAGVIYTKDYRNVDVLAAFVPVENMNLGVVVKIDAAEVRQPFLYIAMYASLAALCIIVVGILLLNKITRPLLDTLEENESKYRSLFDNANEGVMVISDHIEECNDQVVRLLGYDKSEIIGRRIADFAPRHRESDENPVDVTRNRFEMAAQGKPQYFIWRSLRKDDTEIDLDVMLKPVRIGNRNMILTTLLDITRS
ncbi:MAG: PAS domain S-box protein [Pseudomonadales bacterium]